MDWKNPRSVETLIKRLERETTEIDQFFYGWSKDTDRVTYAGMLERKRDDVVRSAVLQFHTAIENMLDNLVLCFILKTTAEDRGRRLSSNRGRALRKMLYGAGSIGFDMKLNFAVALRLLPTRIKERLMDLNTLRNKCSHNWLLKVPVRRGRRPKQTKPPLLMYGGRDLHEVEVLKVFVSEYGVIYANLFVKYCDVQEAFRKH